VRVALNENDYHYENETHSAPLGSPLGLLPSGRRAP